MEQPVSSVKQLWYLIIYIMYHVCITEMIDFINMLIIHNNSTYRCIQYNAFPV